MNTIVYHTKLINGEYMEAPDPSIAVYVHSAECSIEDCSCEPLVKQISEIAI